MTLCTRDETFGGHLEQGNIIFSLAEIVISYLEGVKLKRILDEATQQNFLKVVDNYEHFSDQEESTSLQEVEQLMKDK